MRTGERKWKIALVTYAMYCGGCETFLLNLGTYLVDQGHTVEIIVTEQKGEWYPLILKKGLLAKFIKGGSFLSNYVPFGELFFSFITGLYIRRGQFDVVFINNAKYAQASIGMFNKRAKVIPILHNDHPWVYQISLNNSEAWDIGVCVGEKIYETAKKRLPEKPMMIINHGVKLIDPGLLHGRRPPINKILKLIFIGRLENGQKGIFLIPRILQEMRNRGIHDFSLTIAGDGSDKEKLLQLFHENQLSENITYLGFVSNEEVGTLLLDHHILLMPSYYEGMPIIPLESMAAGCVPVATYLPRITDISIENGKNGLLIPRDDVNAFAEAIIYFHSEPEKWEEFSRNAVDRIRNNFSLEIMGKQYEKLIQELISSSENKKKKKRSGLLNYSNLNIFPKKSFVFILI